MRLFLAYLAYLCTFSGLAFGQTHRFKVLIDSDLNPATGCTVATPDGNMLGVDVLLTTTVDKTTGWITQIDRSVCVGGVFGPPEIISNSPVMIGTGLGLDGTDVVETALPLSGITTAPNVRVGFLAESIVDGAQDAVLFGDQGQDLLVFVFIPVPLLNWLGTALFLVLLLMAAVWILRKNRKIPPASGLVLLLLLGWTQAGIRKDGSPADWQKNGMAPIAIDGFGDNQNPDLRAVYACTQGGGISFRFDSIMNQAPSADNQSQSGLEDQTMNLTLTGSDPESQPITFEIVQNPSHGTVQNLSQGMNQATVDYVPAADYFGMDSFTFRTFDGISYSPIATVSLTLDPVNDAPSFTTGGNVTVFKDQGPYNSPWASQILAGPTNESGQLVQFSILTNDNPSLFSAGPALSPSGMLSFTNTLDANGSANLTVQLQDDGGTANGGSDTSAIVSFSISIGAVNDPPSFTVGPDQTVLEDSPSQTIANWATNISSGPPDEAGQTVSFSLSNNNNALFSVQPAVDSTGTLTYTLAGDSNGIANVSIAAVDNGGTANGGNDTSPSQTFSINVTPVNDPPNFTLAADPSVLEDSGAQSILNFANPISAGPSDESGQTVSFMLSNDNNGLFSVQPSLDAFGTLTFTPAADANGVAIVSVVAMDDGGTANGGNDTSGAQTFNLTVGAVNDPPNFTAGSDVTVLEDSGTQNVMAWATGISPGPADESSQVVSFVASANNPSLFTVQPAIDSMGNLTFSPAADANGSTSISVQAMDDGGTANGGIDTSAAQSFNLTISAVNDSPSFSLLGDQTVLENSSAASIVGFLTNLLPGPPDETGQMISLNVSNDNNGLFSVQPSIDGSGTLSFTPTGGLVGMATVSVSAMDDGGTANGGNDTSATQTFTIEVVAVNDPPSFTAGPDQTVLEDSGLQTVMNWATAISPGPPDESGQTVSFIVTNDNNGLFGVQPAVDGSGTLTFTSALNANGMATVMVTAMDDGGTAYGGVDTSAPQTFTLTVTAVNDAPAFTNGSNQSVLEDSGAATVAAFLTAISAGPPDEASQSVSFLVSNDNNALFDVQPAIDPTGTLTFTPISGTSGMATVMVTAMDDGGTANGGIDTSAAQSFTITVEGINDPPSFTAGMDQTILEDAGAQNVTMWATSISPGPPDELGQTVSFLVSNDNNGLFSVQPAVSSTGTLTYTPAANANGTASVSVTAMDDGGTANGGIDTSAAQTFSITVTAVNDAPSFSVGSDPSVFEDSGIASFSGFLSSISPGPSDESGQTVSFSVSNDNMGLFAVQPAIDSSGILTFTPTAGISGSASVMVSAMDDGGTANGGVDTSAAQSFTITVEGINDPPSFTAGMDQTILEDAGAQNVTMWATSISPGPPDEAGQTVSFVVSNDNNALFAVQPAVSSGGTLTYTPAVNVNGSAIVSVSAMDDGGTANGGIDTSATQAFTISVTAVNDSPNFTVSTDPSVFEDSGAATLNGFITAISPGPPDENGQSVTFDVTNNNNALFAVQPAIDASGTLTFTPNPGTSGFAVVSVTAMDDGGTANGGIDTSTQFFNLTVQGVNDAPSFTAGANETVLEDAGVQAVMGWATAISAGPPDELGQTVSFLVSNDNNALFSSQPAVNTSGTLTYTPAANANGSATVSVSAMDDGGTANGGVDTSAAQTFTITVTAVNDPPTAIPFQASYDAHTHIAISVPDTAGLLVNSTDVESGTILSMDTTPINVTAGATVTLNSDGSFSVNPPADFTGTLSFQYRISDDGDPGPGAFSAYATVEVEVAGPVIWFANDDALPGGNGTLASPFQALADANTASAAGEFIFLFEGNYTGGVTLANSVQLIGQGVTGTSFDDHFGITPPSNSISRPAINGTRPIITSSANGIDIGTNNVLRGFSIGNTTGVGINGNNFTSLTISDCAINGNGAALSLNTGALSATNGFSELSSTNSAGAGISLTNVSGTLSNTLNTSVISGPTGTAFSLSGSNPTVTWQGSITKNNAGLAVNISNMTGGSVNLPGSISANHSGSTGILIDSNSGGANISFTGSITLNTGTNAAVTLTNNGASGGASTSFTSGALDIDTTTGAGFNATGGGTVTVSGAANTIDTSTGVGLNVNGTTLGGMTFRSISVNGAANGIVLNNTGTSGSLTVTGTGAANSGGTLQNLTANGINLTNTLSPSFSHVRILNSTGSGVQGSQVNGFTFTNGLIDNSGTGLGVDASNIAFNTTAAGTETNLTGTVTITNNTLTNAYYHGVDIFNFNGTISELTINSNTITSTTSTATSKGSGIRVIAFGSASTVASITKATLDNNVIRNFPSGLGLQVQGGNANAAGAAGKLGTVGSGTDIIAITNNRISGQSAVNRLGGEAIVTVVNGKGQGNFNISNNGTVGDPIAHCTGTAITNSAFGLAVVTATINNNVISANNSFGSQGIGVGLDQVPGIGDTPDFTVTITNNSVSNTDGNGILAVARNSNGTMRAKIQNNTVAAPLGGVRPGIRIDSGTSTGNTTVCLNISGNTSAGSGGSMGLGLRKQGTVSATNTFGVNGMAATSTPGVEAYINGLNPAGGGTLLISATSGFTNCSLP